VPEDAIWTSALAKARFLQSQRPGDTAFVIGEAGVTTALHESHRLPMIGEHTNDRITDPALPPKPDASNS
jgi:ribonucleotide monophosphatase NagD (HAD superfamily)